MSLVINNLSFKPRVINEINNSTMRKNIIKAQEVIGSNRLKMIDDLGNWEEWRDVSKQIRNHVIQNLDAYLYQLSKKVAENGGNVFFAKDAKEANNYILEVAKNNNAKKVIKSKSMVTEEIGMNHALEEIGIKVVESDLGEYLLQISGDKPSHIVAPAIHKSRDEFRADLEEKLGYKGSNDPEEITAFVRNTIRKDFLTADIGISGCNFAVPETGSICLVTNEGNLRLATTVPKIHIGVMGMERIAPTFNEVDPLITMLARSAVGARLTSYNTWLTGPRLENEVDGPEQFHLVIVDNGRSEILSSEFKEVLRCIRCGACLNTCPAYRQIGGHGYGSIYPGPIGAVISPIFAGYNTFKELPFVCSLCTACDSVCPVKIPLSSLILEHRKNIANRNLSHFGEKILIKGFTLINKHPTLWKFTVNSSAKFINVLNNKDGSPKKIFNHGLLVEWTKSRDLPSNDGNSESFRSWFKKRKNKEIK